MLTARQFAVLLTVEEDEGLSQTDLVNMTGIDRSTLADMIGRMLKKDLLRRRRTDAMPRQFRLDHGLRQTRLATVLAASRRLKTRSSPRFPRANVPTSQIAYADRRSQRPG